ncbi:unnamed protein product, partial [marine sediment metagenome]
NKIKDSEIKMCDKAGNILECLASSEIIEIDSERCLLSIIKDITERKRSEQKILHFQKAVDSSSDAIGISTPTGKHYYQNQSYTELFGWSVEDANRVSRPPRTIYTDEDVRREVFETIMRGGAWNGEVEMIGKDNHKLNILLRAYSIKDEEGKVIGLVGVHTDITERKRAEKKLEFAKEHAEAASAAKSDFLANMSHEIRTPMSVIAGFSDMLVSEELTKEQMAYAELIRNAGKSLLVIINDILDFSKIEAGKLEVTVTDYSLKEILGDVESMMHPLAVTK